MLSGKVLPAKELTEEQIRTMFGIMQKYFENIVWDNFVNDLQGKRDAILLYGVDNKIHGFTTQAIFMHNEDTQLIFSGDTIVEQEYWGANDLWQVGSKNAFNYVRNFKGTTYWLLLSKGYKTYKYLHTFFNHFYPNVDEETPPPAQAIMDKFGREHYGDKYQNGVIKMGKDYLKEAFAVLDDNKLNNKNNAFFLKKNPNYKNGDELVCLAELSLENLKGLGRKMLE